MSLEHHSADGLVHVWFTDVAVTLAGTHAWVKADAATAQRYSPNRTFPNIQTSSSSPIGSAARIDGRVLLSYPQRGDEMGKAKILIVDDEKNIVESVKYNLEKEGFRTIVAHDGAKALELARRELPDLILLDWMLPEIDGLEVCRLLKQEPKTAHMPIVMLTVKSEETDKVLGLEMGADDFVTKPFSPRELIARIKAILRRITAPSTSDVFHVDEFKVDWGKHLASVKGKVVELTSKEFDLLKALVDAKGRVLSRETLLDRVWSYERSLEIETRTVDLHISQLRKKLKPIARRIVTVKNVGYRFRIDE